MANRLRERRKHVHVGSRRDIPVAQRPENDCPCPQLDDSRHCDPGLAMMDYLPTIAAK
jgi:hypothetical protein